VSANFNKAGAVQKLDVQVEPSETIDDLDVADPVVLSRTLTRIMKDIATLKQVWAPRRIDFEDVVFDDSGTVPHRFRHGLGGRVRWFVVDWTGSGATTAAALARHSDTDANTLVLVSLAEGVGTLRVEASG